MQDSTAVIGHASSSRHEQHPARGPSADCGPRFSVTISQRYTPQSIEPAPHLLRGKPWISWLAAMQGPSAAEKEVYVLRDELRSVKQQLDDGTRQLRYQHK